MKNTDGRTTNQAINDLVNFCKQYNRYPDQKSADPYEKSLAVCVSNYKANRKDKGRIFSDEEFQYAQELLIKYSDRSPKMNEYEKIEILKKFCIENGHWPSQSSDDDFEKKLYANCCREKFYKNPTLLDEFNNLKRKYLLFISPSESLKKYREFIDSHRTTPRENSIDAEESKLAKIIKYLKSANKFSEEELAELNDLHKKFGPRGGTSICEQMLYYYLQSVVKDALVYNKENKRYGLEVDILIECTKKVIAIFYDGQAFHQDAEKDDSVSRILIDKGVVVIRFREDGCPPINLGISIPVRKGINYQEFLNEINRYFTREECPIRDLISAHDFDSCDIIEKASEAGSSAYLRREHLLNYIEAAIFKDGKPNTKSNIYRNAKAKLQRNLFTKKETLLYAFTKRLFDSSPRKKRSIDEPSSTNDDIELLSQIIKSFYKNTPYDNNEFKNSLVKKIYDLDNT